MNRVFIIAEAGVNHNGSVEIARKLIDAAADAKADAVKFQTFKADRLASKNADKAEYQKETTDKAESQYEMLKRLELDRDAHIALIDYCRIKGIMFLSTPFDAESIDMLCSFGMEIFKIPSGEITNLPYLRKIGALKKKVILSTGMSDLHEIKAALDILTSSGTELDDITILHATTEYPCPMDEVNLRAMQSIEKAFGVKVGYSDHTKGIEVPVAAAALGAVVIEKHFTLDCTMEGPDHKASLEPAQLKAMVWAIRNVEVALGDGIKRPSKSEEKNKQIARKSIVAAKTIKKGDILTLENITIKRPGHGISPMRLDEVIGSIAQKDYVQDELI
ncbi:MAG: N-acetylneuraminate synthase [Leptonema illini]|uniref:N-acetylneuraminate synthase n=1 Tax=Leptonema illini TaxID=183 RepID=A0A833M2K6_9LEPT|nr:MAG: N-acetylneuraminate synthase [Leptonema illini]